METRELTCINCPMGCQLTVTLENGAAVKVEGQTCPRGEAYARTEVTAPTRTVTSTVPLTARRHGGAAMLSVKTAAPVPKGEMFRVLQCLEGVTATPPVHIGDVILKDAAGLGVDVIATANAE